jgi:DNA-binding response OmpR family regulator
VVRVAERPLAILIVEDRPAIALLIEDIARTFGAEVVGHAVGVKDAMTLVKTTVWDAALLDLALAGGETAYPIAETLRAEGVPFAFLTGSNNDVENRFTDVPVLKKPFSEEALLGCLRMLVRPEAASGVKSAAA